MNKSYPSLDQEIRSAVTTAEASYHLNRQPQTLRIWACRENGPLRPIRINGRLAWPVKELRCLLGCSPYKPTPQEARRVTSGLISAADAIDPSAEEVLKGSLSHA